MQLRKELQSVEWLPTPSPVLAKVLALLEGDESSALDVERVISQDPSIFSQVLKGANSPYFGCRGTVKDIARAIVIIGIKEVRNMCISLCLMQQFSVARISPAFDPAAFWKHTLLVALLAQELVGDRGCMPREEAYTFGLLHDLGQIALAAHLPEDYGLAADRAEKQSLTLYAAEQSLQLPHTKIGAWLAYRWALPDSVRAVLRYHHEPLEATDFRNEAALIHVADSLALEGTETPGAARPEAEVLLMVGLSPEEYFTCLETVPSRAERVESLWHSLTGN